MTKEVDIDKLQDNVKLIKNPDTDLDDIKAITCAFYRGGSNPACVGCMQDEDKVRECSTSYAALILDKPQAVWDENFDKVSERPSGVVPFVNVKGVGLNCNSCYLSERCPLFKEASTCGISWEVDNEMVQPKEGIDYLIKIQLKRVNRAMAIEEYDGGVPDQNLSSEMDRLVSLYQSRADLDTVRIKATLEASGPGGSGKKGPSILERFFGGGNHANQNQIENNNKNQLPESNTIDVQAQVETVKKNAKTKRGNN